MGLTNRNIRGLWIEKTIVELLILISMIDYISASDIYIIKTADLHPGEPLKDVSGDPNTMIGSSTNFDQITIGYAPPDSAMQNDIPYSIVYDECQNGRYDDSQDTVFKNAIIMHVPAILDYPECFQLPSHIARRLQKM